MCRLILFDPFVDTYSGGVPVYKLVFNLNQISGTHLMLKQAANAQIYARKAFALAQKTASLEWKFDTRHTLFLADSRAGDWKAALDDHILYKAYADSLKNDTRSKEMGEVEARMNYEKEAEIKEQQAREEKAIEATRNRWLWSSVGGGFALLTIIAFTLFRGRRKEQRAKLCLTR